MIPERLLVKRQEDFHYPIVFQQTFEKLTQEVLDLKKNSARICIVTDSHVSGPGKRGVIQNRYDRKFLCAAGRGSQ